MSEEKEHKIDAEVVDAFSEGQPVMEKIKKDGFAAYAQRELNLSEVFVPGNKTVVCSDEGTAEEGYCVPGSAILWDEDQAKKYFEDAGIEEITSHKGCGAAAAAGKSDDGQEYARRMAGKLGIRYRHISELRRPEKFHDARAIICSTVKLKPNAENMPKSLVVTCMENNFIQAAKDVLLLVGVVGKHGFGKLFKEENPLIIIPIGKSQEELDEMISRLQEVLNSGVVEIAVKIDSGFVAPEVEEQN